MNTRYRKSKQRGFTLLYASLLGALILAVGLAIFNIGNKELILSSTVRDSQFSFYAADSGVECVLLWDFGLPAESSPFATSTDSSTPPGPFLCAQKDITSDWSVVKQAQSAETIINFDVNSGGNPVRCTEVVVQKTDPPPRTLIEARGYNAECSSGARRVERAIRVSY